VINLNLANSIRIHYCFPYKLECLGKSSRKSIGELLERRYETLEGSSDLEL